ncbi:hypothetical protein MalM25_31190 [Planctomycetes bacterium MalM25]|nr:hypothetical protein MalM25_31190 [Planctomycetes bacterium MalM25]
MMMLSARTGMMLAALACLPLAASASTPFAGEDFDGGASNGVAQPTSSMYTPDNNSNDPPGTFSPGGSFFDRFGIVTREDVPNDVNDDSVSVFPTDSIGYIPETKTDNFFLLVDVENGQNPGGTVSAEWEFNVAGRSNLELSIDFAMVGEFESSDVYEFSYQIDDGPVLPAFTLTGLEGAAYGYTMDDGDFFDRIGSSFFNETEWEDLVDNGPTQGFLAYHPGDDGMDGDTAAEDGVIPVEFAGGFEDIRAYTVTNGNGTFNQAEFAPTIDPLAITSGDGTLVDEIISADDLTTYTTALTGSGSVLTLMLNGVGNGGNEYLSFDDILLSEGDDTMVLEGDFDGNGSVGDGDLTLLLSNWGQAVPPVPAGWDGFQPTAPGVGDDELTALLNNWGSSASGVAVPEPTAALLAVLAMGAFAARRQG